MSKTYDELLYRSQFTKLMVNIHDDIKKLAQVYGRVEAVFNDVDALKHNAFAAIV
ncbi:MAG: hypothetical protein LEGION0403_FIIPPAGN_00873 [Legionella sp.]|uniref:hypothetical protein n=1 Tax=Legionella sp. TaxID=459 RepID=UPI003D0AE372